MKTFALRVQQPLGEFFVTALSANTLVGRVRNRPRSSAKDHSEDIQRIFSERRVNDIAKFTSDPQATFPTPIILAVDSATVPEVAVDESLGKVHATPELYCFDIPDEGMIGDVLDGQHRILGLERSTEKDQFELPVVLMFDLSVDDQAFVFSIINSKQTPVSGSLIYDLFDLSKYPSPQRTCHFVAQALNSTEGGPFYRRLKMLGHKERHHGDERRVMLSQGSFAARLQELISKNATEDVLRLKRGERITEDARCPLRKYFADNDDQSILKIVNNFFTAAARCFSTEWNDESGTFVIRKTVGYTALIIVMRHVLEEGFAAKNLTEAFFLGRFLEMKRNLDGTPLTAQNFPTNGAGAIGLAKALLGVSTLAYRVKDAQDIEGVRLEN